MGIAYASTLGEGETFTTVELKINFLRPFREGLLIAEGSIVSKGRSIGYTEAEVRDEGGSLIAKASSTCKTLGGGQVTRTQLPSRPETARGKIQ